MDIKKLKGNLELLAEKVHHSWEKEKRNQGFHSPNECKSRENEDKFCKWCDKCHADLYPYNELSDNIKEYDRVTVRTVLAAIEEII